MSKHINIGNLGEDIAVKHLVSKGLVILERNYRNGYGEIDIVAIYEDVLRFIEVKTVTRETETNNDSYRPEENMHKNKIKTLLRTINKYLLEKGNSKDWQMDLIAIELHVKHKTAKVRFLEKVV